MKSIVHEHKVKKSRLCNCFFLIILFSCVAPTEKKLIEDPYSDLKRTLLSGWSTFNTYNSLSYVYMPQGFEIAFDFKYQGHNFSEYLHRVNFGEGNDFVAIVTPVGEQKHTSRVIVRAAHESRAAEGEVGSMERLRP